ncbi:hypothetical protein QZH56_31530 [Streptomyces olivoreticuli]|uniref:hypothetical protein n=1 Tax=Streptomyces olivoreticuli TaxID=68246 RepID=UPI002659F8DF|nr:hypothetical protein [Streptomyces olivoreticuli]WKK23222.1 hypothetical protein QZH56_31530 [Streptomyces olivoreticuli]
MNARCVPPSAHRPSPCRKEFRFIDYELTVLATAHVRLGASSGRITVRGVAGADIDTSSGNVKIDAS